MTNLEGLGGVKPDVLQTLKHLAIKSSLTSEVKVSCSGLANELGTSDQTVSRRLQSLEDDDLIRRQMESDGQWIKITQSGEDRLRNEYQEYKRIFEDEQRLELTGEIVTGMGEGSYYISLEGYKLQFIEKLGYEPYPGTLNLELDEESTKRRGALTKGDGVEIEEWSNEERTFGGATCYPADIDGVEGHIIKPHRSHYPDSMLEVIAPVKLFDELDLSSGDDLTVEVLIK